MECIDLSLFLKCKSGLFLRLWSFGNHFWKFGCQPWKSKADLCITNGSKVLSFCITYKSKSLRKNKKRQINQNFGTVCHTEVCLFSRLAAKLSEIITKFPGCSLKIPASVFFLNFLKCCLIFLSSKDGNIKCSQLLDQSSHKSIQFF